MHKLTNKQKRFIDEYLIDLNATAAASRAGYKNSKMAAKLVAKGSISEAIQAAMKEKSEQAGITIQNIITDLSRIAKKAEDTGQLSAAIKALELLGKHIGMFIDRHEIKNSDIRVVVDYVHEEI